MTTTTTFTTMPKHLGLFLALGLPLPALLGGCTARQDLSNPSVAWAGSFTVKSTWPVSHAGSYRQLFSFGSAACALIQSGVCRINPCYLQGTVGSASAPLPNAGLVRVVGGEMAPFSALPQSDGSYIASEVDGTPAWKAGGEALTFLWEHFPGSAGEAGDTITMSTPAYVTLATASPFSAMPVTVARDHDLTVSWSYDTTPAATDVVVVNVMSGPTQVGCKFGAATGIGVVPSEVLQHLGAGGGTYDIHSKASASKKLTGTDGATWELDFNVDAEVRTTYGVANGPVTLQ